MAELILAESAAPSTPSSGFGTLYVKTDGLLYWKSDGGTEYAVASLAGAETLTNKTLTAPVINPASNTQTDSYTLVLGDASKDILMNKGTANTLTIPANAAVAFPVDTVIGVVQIGAGATLIDGDTGVTVNTISGGSGTMAGQHTAVVLKKTATNTWLCLGNITIA